MAWLLGPLCLCSVVACLNDLFTLSVMQHQPTPTSVSIPEADAEFQYRLRRPIRNFSIDSEGRYGISVSTPKADTEFQYRLNQLICLLAHNAQCVASSRKPRYGISVSTPEADTEIQYRPPKPIRKFNALRCPRHRSSQAIPDIGVGRMAHGM